MVVLTGATTDLRAYERALEEQGIPTYLIGGRGYWSHPQVMDLVAYLRALANPHDQEAYYQLLASPLVGLSIDALVLVASAMRAGEELPGLPVGDAERLATFTDWFAAERGAVGNRGLEDLIERAIVRGGYDLHTLGLPGGGRRLANLRKLMRLGREHEHRFGRDLRGFLDLVGARTAGLRADARESEAPVEGEALDAVRLMTIHRAKGLEFKIVAVADLGRDPWRRSPLLRVSADGRIGLRVARPGTRKQVPALDYDALGDEQQLSDAAEERRIFYVGMTRAQERLILTGAAKLGEDGSLALRPPNGPRSPINWIARAMAEADVQPTIVSSEEPPGERERVLTRPGPVPCLEPDEPAPPETPSTPVLSYSALAEYDRCGYRFYLERVLGLPPWQAVSPDPGRSSEASSSTSCSSGSTSACPLPKGTSDDVAELIQRLIETPLFERLAAANDTRREEGFAFVLESGALVTGALDVVTRERDGRMLVVDYKTDRLEGADPAAVVERDYRTQRVIYALAALRAGATEVEVAHVFLERPHEPVTATFSDRAALEHELEALAGGVLGGDFRVSGDPCVALCNGCPAEGGLCSWPLETTRREAPGAVAAGAEAPASEAPASEAVGPEAPAPEAVGPEAREPEFTAAEAQGRLFRPSVGVRELDVDLLLVVTFLDLGQLGQSFLVRVRARRTEQAARPELAGQHDVDLGAIEHDLSPQVQPDDQRDHEPEHPVSAARVLEHVADVVPADCLEDRPQNRCHGDSDPKDTGPDNRGHEPERGQEQGEVDDQRDRNSGDLCPRASEPTGDEARRERRDDEQQPERDQQRQAPEPRLDEVGALLHRHGPDARERALRGLRDALPAEQRGHDADDERDRVSLNRADIRFELRPDHRELAEHGVLDRVPAHSRPPAARTRAP